MKVFYIEVLKLLSLSQKQEFATRLACMLLGQFQNNFLSHKIIVAAV